MTRFSPRTAPRSRAGGLAATALLLAAGPLTAAAPALAAAPVFALGGPAETALHPYAEGGGEPKRSAAGITVTNPAGAEGGEEGEFTVTFDLTGVAGIADIAFDERPGVECATAGTRAVCAGQGISPGRSTVTDLLVSATAGSEHGDSGTIGVTGEAGGTPFTPFTTRVTVGGPDLVMRKLPFEQELTPGQKQQAPITFTNRGSRAADGVVLTLRYSRGLDIPQRYSNCAYATGDPGWTTVRCSVDGAFEAGATYTLATPLTLEATTRAYRDVFLYGIHEADGDRRAVVPPERGEGAPLRAVPVKQGTGVRGVDLEPGDNEREAGFRTANTADFVAYGDTASGAAGASVTADIGLRNDGPAWIGHLRSGGSVAAVDFTVPQGATVTSAPEGCRGVTAEGEYREDRKTPAPRYVCPTPTTVRDGGGLDLSFGLRIDKVLIGAAGRVTVRGPGLGEPGLPFDPKPGNNTARVVLNGEGGGPSTAPTRTPGTGSGTGGSTAAGATGGDGADVPDGTGGPGASGAATGSGHGNGGSLAATGSSALTASATAAAVLAAGLALVTAARRRRA